jgi:hypothetical protein
VGFEPECLDIKSLGECRTLEKLLSYPSILKRKEDTGAESVVRLMVKLATNTPQRSVCKLRTMIKTTLSVSSIANAISFIVSVFVWQILYCDGLFREDEIVNKNSNLRREAQKRELFLVLRPVSLSLVRHLRMLLAHLTFS